MPPGLPDYLSEARARFAAAEKAANRIIKNADEQFESLKQKATGLEQQLTDISTRVTKISEDLAEIEKAINAVRERVV